MINLHTVPGAELPPLVWHHREAEDAAHIAARWRQPMFDGYRSKPVNGLYASVMQDSGRGPVSSWGRWCDEDDPGRAGAWVSTVIPDPQALFVVIDSAADAVAAAQAFPGAQGTGTLARILGKDLDDFKAKVPDPSPLMASMLGYGDRQPPLIDWTAMEPSGFAGTHLTERGLAQCTTDTPGVPDFWGWDVPQVWFRSPVLRVAQTVARQSV